jgi:hypothetical protein
MTEPSAFEFRESPLVPESREAPQNHSHDRYHDQVTLYARSNKSVRTKAIQCSPSTADSKLNFHLSAHEFLKLQSAPSQPLRKVMV